jgi:hypothetical protein
MNRKNGSQSGQSPQRRAFLKQAGLLGSAAMFAAGAQEMFALGGERGPVLSESLQASPAPATPKYHIKFGVCGMSHDHIYGMVAAMIRGGGVLVSVYAAEPERGAEMLKRYPDA